MIEERDDELGANEGFIVLFRKLLKWEWASEPKMISLWVHLLLSANHKKKRWKGIEVGRGQLVTGRHQLSKQTGISPQSLRTCLERLKSTNEITIRSTNKYSLITIVNYDTYQTKKERPTSRPTSKSTNDQQTTNHKQQCKQYSLIINKQEQDPSSGRYALANFPNLWMHEREIAHVQKVWRAAGLNDEEIAAGFQLADVELEMRSSDIRARGGLASKYLLDHILTNALKKKAAESYSKKGTGSGAQKPVTQQETKHPARRIFRASNNERKTTQAGLRLVSDLSRALEMKKRN